jgi:microcystin-dependent protein
VDAVELLYRIAKGQPLTDLELDDNFRKLKTAVNYLLEEIAASTTSSAIRGEIKMFGGASLPTGYLWCNGAAVSRVTYADLFAVVGTKFGAGNGTTTFNLPDFRGASPMGSNPMGGSTKGSLAARTDGAIVGAETASANHTHTASGTLSITPVSYTPSGTISVVNYSGSVTPSITTTVNSATLSTTPSGSVSSTTALTSASPNINVEGEACTLVRYTTGETETNLMNCVALTVSTANVISALTPATTSGFTGVEDDLGHSHTASSTSGAISLNHGHSATFTGGNATLSPTGTASVTVDTKTLSVSTIQPSQVCNFIIKY